MLSKDKEIRIVIISPKCEPEIIEIENSLTRFQSIVGGYIETLSMDSYIIVCNEEGKIYNLPPNRYIPKYRDTICGTFFITKVYDGEFISLSSEEAKKIAELYSLNSLQYKAFI